MVLKHAALTSNPRCDCRSATSQDMTSNVNVAPRERRRALVWNLQHQKLVNEHSKRETINLKLEITPAVAAFVSFLISKLKTKLHVTTVLQYLKALNATFCNLCQLTLAGEI
jgi:hypothetical protein